MRAFVVCFVTLLVSAVIADPPPPELFGVWEAEEAPGCHIVAQFDYGSYSALDCQGFMYLGVYTVNGDLMTVNYTYEPSGPAPSYVIKFELDGDRLQLAEVTGAFNLTYYRMDARPYDGIWEGENTDLENHDFFVAVQSGMFMSYAVNRESQTIDRHYFGYIDTVNDNTTIYYTYNNSVAGSVTDCDLVYDHGALHIGCRSTSMRIILTRRLPATIFEGTWIGQNGACVQTSQFDGNFFQTYDMGASACMQTGFGSFYGLFTYNSTHFTCGYGFTPSVPQLQGADLTFAYTLNGYNVTISGNGVDLTMTRVWH